VDGWKLFAATIDTWERSWQEHKLFFGQKDVKETYVLRDLVDITGAGRRTIQFWADHGVLIADKDTVHAGTGTHRRFSRDEAIIACLVQAFAKHVGIGELIEVAKVIRNRLADPRARKVIDRAMRDEKSPATLAFETWNDKGPRYRATLWLGIWSETQTFFDTLFKPDGFVSVIRLRTYLARMNE
jgi:hypothetical protein